MSALQRLRMRVSGAAEAVDRFVAERFRQAGPENCAKISCREGCDHCCYLLSTATLPEVIHLVATLWESGREFDLDSIQSQFESVIEPGQSLAIWHESQFPCVGLYDNRCGAYEARPQTCRTHFVVSPSDDCTPPTKGYLGVDMRGSMDVGMPLLILAAREAGIPICYGPVPFLVPIAIVAVEKGFDVATAKLEEMGMVSPESLMRWMHFAA